MRKGVTIRPISRGDPAEIERMAQSVCADKSEAYRSDIGDFEDMLNDMSDFTYVAATGPSASFPQGRPVGMSASVILTRRPTVRVWEQKYERKNLSTWHNPGGLCFYLGWLMVNPEYQNNGIGTELFYTNARLARSKGFADMNFLANKGNEKFYTGLGARPIEKEYTKYFGEPSKWWEMDLHKISHV